MAYTTAIKLLDGVLADTTSGALEIGDRILKSIQFIASGITSGNGVFTVEVTNDQDANGAPQNWVVYNRLTDNVANTNAQQDTRVASATLSSNTSKMYFFPAGDTFRYMRAKVDETTDGAYSAIVNAVVPGV